MIGIVIATHGDLGSTLLETVEEIAGPVPMACAIAIRRHEGLADIEERLREAIQRLDRGQGVLILTDMFGGTASNVALRLLDEALIEVVTGVNLPMLLKATRACDSGEDIGAVAQLLKYYGQRNVMVASEILKERAQ